ncbi:hypothetical protein [Alteromonas ponticola]|uniref:Uncharacterized protein n=1 Tax=Alteromonas ponticola TaxID=2720613 RepID=A0ABX1R1M8_9ALTE|nr:hypothetical protein [Alteromonas ponticola]NMH59158.1 hypothetical protein [Alteromonas ponticola]
MIDPIDETAAQEHSNKEHFDYQFLRILVGWIALVIALVCYVSYCIWVGKLSLPSSISATFHFGAVIPFVGLLFIVSAFLACYGERGSIDSMLSSLGAICACIVAVFPTSIDMKWVKQTEEVLAKLPAFCNIKENVVDGKCLYNHYPLIKGEWIPVIHISAAIFLIAILCIFCRIFWVRAKRKLEVAKPENKIKVVRRILIYQICCGLMPVSAAIGWLVKDDIHSALFWVEFVCLVAFGVSWLVAGKAFKTTSNSKHDEDDLSEKIGKVAPVDFKIPFN